MAFVEIDLTPPLPEGADLKQRRKLESLIAREKWRYGEVLKCISMIVRRNVRSVGSLSKKEMNVVLGQIKRRMRNE